MYNFSKYLKSIFLWLGFFMLIPGHQIIYAQTDTTKAATQAKIDFDPLVDNIQDKLPPLEVLIDSAIINAPRIRMQDAEISLFKYRLQETRRLWTKNFGLISDFTYGNRYQFTTSETAGATPTEFLSTGSQTFFDVGVYLKMPVFEVFNRKNAINQSKRQIESQMVMKEQIIRETKQAVIFAYQDLLLHQDLLKVKNEAQVTSAIQVKMAEKEFLNGKISITELSRLTERHSDNLYNYKKDRMLFYKQYLLLEQLVGMEFNLLNEIF